jgi:MFS family permease
MSHVAVAAQAGYAIGLLFFVPLGDVLERRSLIFKMIAGLVAAMLITAAVPALLPAGYAGDWHRTTASAPASRAASASSGSVAWRCDCSHSPPPVTPGERCAIAAGKRSAMMTWISRWRKKRLRLEADGSQPLAGICQRLVLLCKTEAKQIVSPPLAVKGRSGHGSHSGLCE